MAQVALAWSLNKPYISMPFICVVSIENICGALPKLTTTVAGLCTLTDCSGRLTSDSASAADRGRAQGY